MPDAHGLSTLEVIALMPPFLSSFLSLPPFPSQVSRRPHPPLLLHSGGCLPVRPIRARDAHLPHRDGRLPAPAVRRQAQRSYWLSAHRGRHPGAGESRERRRGRRGTARPRGPDSAGIASWQLASCHWGGRQRSISLWRFSDGNADSQEARGCSCGRGCCCCHWSSSCWYCQAALSHCGYRCRWQCCYHWLCSRQCSCLVSSSAASSISSISFLHPCRRNALSTISPLSAHFAAISVYKCCTSSTSVCTRKPAWRPRQPIHTNSVRGLQVLPVC